MITPQGGTVVSRAGSPPGWGSAVFFCGCGLPASGGAILPGGQYRVWVEWVEPHKVRFAWLYVGLAAIALFQGVVAFDKLCSPEEVSLHGRPIHDETYYVRIADEGYSLPEGNYREWNTLPFSPGYPALLRGFSAATFLEIATARLILSSILFLVGCMGLAALYDTFSDDRGRNHLAIALFAFWPGSFYFLSGYAESLYLPLAVWCLTCLRKRWFLAASALAALALFTRSPAVILVPTICVAAISDWLRQTRQHETVPRLVGRLAACCLISALGLAAYIWVIWVAIGDPWAIFKAYDAWGAASHLGFDNYTMDTCLRAVFLFANHKHLPVMLGLLFFLAIPLIVFPLRTHLPAELLAFTAIGWLFLLDRNGLQDPFIDMLRWSSILFPAHYCLAIWIQRIGGRFRSCLAAATLFVFGALYAWVLTRFIHGQWVS